MLQTRATRQIDIEQITVDVILSVVEGSAVSLLSNGPKATRKLWHAEPAADPSTAPLSVKLREALLRMTAPNIY